MAGKIIVLMLLIVVLAAGGIVWFDYLNVIDAKTFLSPLYRFIGREGRSQPQTAPDEYINIDAERLAARLEALELLRMEMENEKGVILLERNEIGQMAQELEERQKALDEREDSLRAQAEDAENKDRNIEANARMLTGMPPRQAVDILSESDDQLIIDVLRKTEEIARAEGSSSLVPYWLSLMEPARAAEIQRKMAIRP